MRYRDVNADLSGHYCCDHTLNQKETGSEHAGCTHSLSVCRQILMTN